MRRTFPTIPFNIKTNIHEIKENAYIECLHDLKVGHVDLRMLGQVGVLFGHHHALLEEVLVDQDQVLLGHQHPGGEQDV